MRVIFEETGEEREVVSACKVCRADIGDPVIVSSAGVAHESEGYGVTVCGKDATGETWWWRL